MPHHTRDRSFLYRALGVSVFAAALWLFTAGLKEPTVAAAPPPEAPAPPKTVKGLMQARPGGPLEEVEVAVHEVPVDLPSVPADKAQLDDDELVLGVVVDTQAIAYPIRYLAMFEVVDHRVGDTPLAPTW